MWFNEILSSSKWTVCHAYRFHTYFGIKSDLFMTTTTPKFNFKLLNISRHLHHHIMKLLEDTRILDA
jgi:hypothetical protein